MVPAARTEGAVGSAEPVLRQPQHPARGLIASSERRRRPEVGAVLSLRIATPSPRPRTRS
ncbi:hypothetical protein MICRO8M_100408 [Microbacterium sp. 8M]|nr:hypothetical protein MICRO8M_100408 [Microbacterium sp. 8M]